MHGRNPERVEQTVNRLQKISGTEVHGYLEHEGLLGIGPETFKVGKGLSEKNIFFNGCIVWVFDRHVLNEKTRRISQQATRKWSNRKGKNDIFFFWMWCLESSYQYGAYSLYLARSLVSFNLPVSRDGWAWKKSASPPRLCSRPEFDVRCEEIGSRCEREVPWLRGIVPNGWLVGCLVGWLVGWLVGGWYSIHDWKIG